MLEDSRPSRRQGTVGIAACGVRRARHAPSFQRWGHFTTLCRARSRDLPTVVGHGLTVHHADQLQLPLFYFCTSDTTYRLAYRDVTWRRGIKPWCSSVLRSHAPFHTRFVHLLHPPCRRYSPYPELDSEPHSGRDNNGRHIKYGKERHPAQGGIARGCRPRQRGGHAFRRVNAGREGHREKAQEED